MVYLARHAAIVGHSRCIFINGMAAALGLAPDPGSGSRLSMGSASCVQSEVEREDLPPRWQRGVLCPAAAGFVNSTY